MSGDPGGNEEAGIQFNLKNFRLPDCAANSIKGECMKQSELLIIIILNVLFTGAATGKFPGNPEIQKVYALQSDTLPENQFFFNGRVWRNYYSMVEEDQFLFSKEFLPGEVIMRGRTYPDVMILYDIFNDEILTPYKPVGILQLNREMVDSFSLLFRNKRYRFIKMNDNTNPDLKGYFNVLYTGKTTLFVKYFKKIEKLEAKGENNKFYQLTHIYLEKDSLIYPVTGKNDLIRIYDEDKKIVSDYIKKNKLRISKSDPESFIPVLRFTDSLNR